MRAVPVVFDSLTLTLLGSNFGDRHLIVLNCDWLFGMYCFTLQLVTCSDMPLIIRIPIQNTLTFSFKYQAHPLSQYQVSKLVA
jgi:hypothetical protein